MNIEKITNDILPILEQNGESLHRDVTVPRERLAKIFEELHTLVEKSQDFIDLTRVCHVLSPIGGEEDLGDQASTISRLAQEKLGKRSFPHTTFLSRSAVEKSDRGYLELLWSSEDLLSDTSNLLASKRDKKPSDFVLPIDIDSLSEQIVSQFSSRFPLPTAQQTFLSITMQVLFPILNYLGLARPVKDRQVLAKDILREVFLFMKYNEAPNLSFLDKKDPLAVQMLFSAVHYLGLDDFQKKHLEPFNKKFPEILLAQAPWTVLSLDFSGKDVTGFDFLSLAELFPHLEEIDLTEAQNFTPAQISQIPASVKVLKLQGRDVRGVDFSRFKHLEELDLSWAKNLTPAQINQIPASVKVLKLQGRDVRGVDFSRFKHLEEIDLSWAKKLTPTQISQIPASVKVLKLQGCNVTGIDFSRFESLKEIDLYWAENLTPAQISRIPASVKVLKLEGCDVAGVDFSRFKHLEGIDLSNAKNLTAAQISQIPASVKVLGLRYCNVTGVDFSRFKHLEEINLSEAKNLTPDQINQISASVKVLALAQCDVTGVDFSRFESLKEIDLFWAKNLTAQQRSQLPLGCKVMG